MAARAYQDSFNPWGACQMTTIHNIGSGLWRSAIARGGERYVQFGWLPESRTLKRMGLVALVALSGALAGGTGALAGGTVPIGQVIPQMTIEIYNNSTNFNIYPLISFPGQGSVTTGQPGDKWMQGFFGVTKAALTTNKYASQLTLNGKPAVTRMYVNCCEDGENGIPPGGSVTIKLPLYSPLVNSINPATANQLIEWWQGGNVNVYVQSHSAAGLPAALEAHWADATQQKPGITNGPARCVAPASCHIFLATTGNPLPNEPQQLVEFTLGAAPENPKSGETGQAFFLFDPKNVDYDVSYVNTAYTPVVMEPFGNSLMGWVGAPDTIGNFSTSVDNFLAGKLKDGSSITLGQNWPLLIGGDGKTVPGKIASALEIFAGSLVVGGADDGQWVSPSKYLPAPANSPPIKRLINVWQTCQSGSTHPICAGINDTTKLLRANFENYQANYFKNTTTGWNCDQTQLPHPQTKLTDLQLLQHLYGWQPFNEHCNADANLLQATPGFADKTKPKNYQQVKNEFDQLQYWVDVLHGKYGAFHPYVSLIHGPDYVNAPYTYAYSVDDAVGNVQTDGTGVIVAVGGLQNLPNPDHATPDVHFNFGAQADYNGQIVKFTKYGRCKATPDTDINPNFASFPIPIGVTKSVGDCLVTFEDNLGRNYQFKVQPPNPTWPTNPDFNPEGQSYVLDSCDKNTDPRVLGWCKAIWVYQFTMDDARSTVSYNVQIGAPPPPSN